jgi:hypothetical protein
MLAVFKDENRMPRVTGGIRGQEDGFNFVVS